MATKKKPPSKADVAKAARGVTGASRFVSGSAAARRYATTRMGAVKAGRAAARKAATRKAVKRY